MSCKHGDAEQITEGIYEYGYLAVTPGIGNEDGCLVLAESLKL